MLNGQLADLTNVIQDSFGGIPQVVQPQGSQPTYGAPQQPQRTYSDGVTPYSREEAFNAMTAKNGGAPTQSMLNTIGAYGQPVYLMNQHRDQLIKNRKDEISNVYQDMLGRAATQDERKAGSMSGLEAPDYYEKLSTSPEFLKAHQSELAAFDPTYYMQQNPDVAASPRYGNNALGHYNDWGKNEGRSPYDPNNFTYDMDKAKALSTSLRDKYVGNKQIAQTPSYVNDIDALKKEIETLKSQQNSYSESGNSNWWNSGG